MRKRWLLMDENHNGEILMWICGDCGEHYSGQASCPKCGSYFSERVEIKPDLEWECLKCSDRYPNNEVACPQCGYPLGKLVKKQIGGERKVSIDEKMKELHGKGVETALVQCPGCSKDLIVMKSDKSLGITWV